MVVSKHRFRFYWRRLKLHVTQNKRSLILALLIIWIFRMILREREWQNNQKVQFHFSRIPGKHFLDSREVLAQERKEEIVQEFRWTFNMYRKHAWGHDEVRPVSGQFSDSRNGWGATAIDALTTAMVMNLTEEVTLIGEYVLNELDWDKARDDVVDPFETIIRYLGALVSAVDIIDSGAMSSLPNLKKYRDGFLNSALKLAKKLGPAYDSPLGMLWPRVSFAAGIGINDGEDFESQIVGKMEKSFTADPARTGSNWLENFLLSDLTGDETYLNNATRAWQSLVWNRNAESFDGLIDAPIDGITGISQGKMISIGAGHDSYYEYLIKAAQLAPKHKYAATYAHRWEQAMDSVKNNLVFSGTPVNAYEVDGGKRTDGYRFIARYVNGMYVNEMEHLSCYITGNLMLGGKLLGREDLVQLGLDLLSTCHATYKTVTGLGPERFVFHVPQRSGKTESVIEGGFEDVQWAISSPGQHEIDQMARYGYWISNARYPLRPEVIEGYFYAYRITGDEKYRGWAWAAFQSLKQHCKSRFGYGEVEDVSLPRGSRENVDNSESFFLAETLKYLYLIFDDPYRWSLDRWVFTTEAHPMRVRD
ncbi:glycoside hydrolase [Dipodascopsis uninucleata]